MFVLLFSLSVEPLPSAWADHCALYDAIRREEFPATGPSLIVKGADEQRWRCPGWPMGNAAATLEVVFEPPQFATRVGSASVDYTVLTISPHFGRVIWWTAKRCFLENDGDGWRIKSCSVTSSRGQITPPG